MGDGVATLLKLLRPRDRKWKDGETCKGTGRHGEGKEEEWRLETSAEKEIFVDDHCEFDEKVDRQLELVVDAVDDQGVEVMLLEDPLQHQHR